MSQPFFAPWRGSPEPKRPRSAPQRAGRFTLGWWALAFCVAMLGVVFGHVTAQAADQNGVQPRFALVIANSAYPAADTPLDSATPDARALRDELQRAGFVVDLRENATFSVMHDAIDHLIGATGPNSVALIYFKGYGIQAFHQTYMIPIDAQIWSDAEVQRYGFAIDDLLAELGRHGTPIKIAIVDAAYSNPFERRYHKVPLGLAPINVPDGTLTLFSAALGKLVDEHPVGMSLFARELVKQISLKNEAAEEVFNLTRLHVSEATQGAQVPWMSSSMGQGFSFDRSFVGQSRPASGLPVAKPPEAQADCSQQSGSVVLDDKFTDNRGGWDLRNDIVKLDPPELVFSIGKQVSAYSAQIKNLTRVDGDYCMSFELPDVLENGARSGAGIEFWAKDYKNFYAALLFSDRTVGLYEHKASGWRSIFENETASGISMAPFRPNSVRVLAQGDTVSVFVNGILIREANLTPPQGTLHFGVYTQVGKRLSSNIRFHIRQFLLSSNK